jgi:acetolactate synthase-1/2/3 large subunit
VAVPTAAPVPRAADAAAVRAAAELLGASQRPVLVVGGGAKTAADQVRRLAEALQAPVVTTTNGKGTLPEDHELALGAGVHLPAVADLVAESDVVVAVGTELAPADLWYGPLPVAGKLVRVDIDPVGMVTNASPRVALLGDAAVVLDSLLAALPDADPDAGEAHGPGHDVAAWRERKVKDARSEGAEWVEVVEALAAALPREAVVGADNAMACYFGAQTGLPTYGPATFLFPTGFGTLGYGLPAAIGVKVGDPDRPVVAMLGDGGVMFTVAELATAAELRLPLPVLIVDNNGYGEIRNEMAERGDPLHAVTFPAPDFAALGRAVGCHGVTLTGPAGLTAAVRDALTADRPTVIHLRMPEGAPA